MGRRSLKEERQKEMVKAFYKVAKKEGIENASIAKVADSLGINPSLVIHYFKSKDELLQALVNFNLDRYLSIYTINGEIDSKEKLLELIDNLFSRKWNRLFDDGVYYSCYALIYRNQKFKEEFKILHDSLRQNLAEALNEAKQYGIIEIEDIEQTVEIVYAFIEGAYYYLGMVSDKTEFEKKSSWFKKRVRIILGVA